VVVDLLRRNPAFRRVYIADLVSAGGDWFSTVALLGLILGDDGSATLAGLLFVANVLPGALISPIAGSLADRFDRRALMITSEVAAGALTLTYLLVDRDTLWLAFVVAVLVASFKSLFMPSAQAAIPNLVEPHDLATANALIASSWGLMLAVGAALGGAITALFGREVAFVIDSLTYLVAASMLWRVRVSFQEHTPQRRRAPETSARTDLHELFGFIRETPSVGALLLVKGGFGLSAGVMTLVAATAEASFDAGTTGIGLLMSARGAGVLVGPFVFRRLFSSTDRGLFVGVVASFVTFAGGYLLFGAAPVLAIAAIGAFVGHLGGGGQWTLSTLGLQRLTPDRIRGRVFAADFTLVSLTMAMSVAAAGWLADRVGPQLAATWLAFGCLAYAIFWPLATRRWWPARAPVVAHEPVA
jgi:MFS family permease